jgi:hypothetical protein
MMRGMSRPDLRDPEQWLPRDLFAAYCGPHSDKLLAYYDKAKAKRQLIVFAFDALAFFVLPAWLGYRRQWALWATLVGTIALITVTESVVRFELPSGAFAGALFALGMAAQGLLLTNANALFLKLKRQGLEEGAIRAALVDKARPSVGHAILGLVGAVAVQGILLLVLP